MVKKSNKYEVIKRLTSRYKLQEAGYNMLTMGDDVIPITNADDLLKTPQHKQATGNLTGAGRVTFYTVPEGKRWRLKAVQRGSSAGTSNVGITYGGNTLVIILDGTAAATEPKIDIPMDTGWVIDMSASGNGADTAVALRVIYEEEDAY